MNYIFCPSTKSFHEAYVKSNSQRLKPSWTTLNSLSHDSFNFWNHNRYRRVNSFNFCLSYPVQLLCMFWIHLFCLSFLHYSYRIKRMKDKKWKPSWTTLNSLSHDSFNFWNHNRYRGKTRENLRPRIRIDRFQTQIMLTMERSLISWNHSWL